MLLDADDLTVLDVKLLGFNQVVSQSGSGRGSRLKIPAPPRYFSRNCSTGFGPSRTAIAVLSTSRPELGVCVAGGLNLPVARKPFTQAAAWQRIRAVAASREPERVNWILARRDREYKNWATSVGRVHLFPLTARI
jgi:hypothetical protein